MTLRGEAAIVGIGELPTRRTYPGRTTNSLCTEAARTAIADAGLRKEDIDGLITPGSDVSPMDLAEYMGIHVGFCEGVTPHGSSGAHAVVVAAAAIHAGLAHTVLCVFGGHPGSGSRRLRPWGGAGDASGQQGQRVRSAIRAGAGHQHGRCPAEAAPYVRVRDDPGAVRHDGGASALQRPDPSACGVPGASHHCRGRLTSRMVNDPLHWLECVMPCGGAAACLITAAARAKSWPHPPVYLLGAGAGVSDQDIIWQSPRMTTTPVVISARKAYEMAGYRPKDIQFAECDD
jgi:acetyl-CoA acetyltransferase